MGGGWRHPNCEDLTDIGKMSDHSGVTRTQKCFVPGWNPSGVRDSLRSIPRVAPRPSADPGLLANAPPGRRGWWRRGWGPFKKGRKRAKEQAKSFRRFHRPSARGRYIAVHGAIHRPRDGKQESRFRRFASCRSEAGASRSRGDQRAFSMASVTSVLSGLVWGSKRASGLPSLPMRNLPKFHFTSPGKAPFSPVRAA